jgi:hypothetical protein
LVRFREQLISAGKLLSEPFDERRLSSDDDREYSLL